MNKIWGAFGMDANEEEEEDYVENNEEMEEEEENNKENKLSNYFNLTVNHLEFFYYGN